MKKTINKIILIIALLVLFFVPNVYASTTEPETYIYTIKGTRDYEKAYEIAEMVNKERVNAGLPELTIETNMMEYAMTRAAEIAIYYDSSHLRPNGMAWHTLFESNICSMAGENIAAYQISTIKVMNDWMKSTGHKANILDANFDVIGVGVFKSELGYYYWTQWFGKSTAGSIEQTQSNRVVTEDVEVKYGILPFWDVIETDYFYNALCYNVANKYILGYNSNIFGPSLKMNRAMVVTVLWRMEGRPEPSGDKTLSDIKSTDYYSKAVNWAVNAGVVNGREDGTFRPNDNISRQDLLVMLRNYLRYKKGDDAVRVRNDGTYETFADINKVDNYAKSAVMWAVENTVIRGKTNDGKTYIDPKGASIRADVACVFSNYGKAYFTE